jgi:DNA-directed RNA polymerase subunit RPC12/RpoP
MTTTSKTTVCPTCGHEMPVGAKFCLNCGKKLLDDPRLCPKCGHKIIQGMKFCQNCGTPISEMMEQVSEEQSICPSCGKPIVPGTKFCRYCGATISDDSGESETENDEIKVEKPTKEPTVEPMAEPTVEPTVEATAEPTAEPTVEPTVEATAEPTVEPTVEATVEATVEPMAEPTEEPTKEPQEVEQGKLTKNTMDGSQSNPLAEPNSLDSSAKIITQPQEIHRACGLPFKFLTGLLVLLFIESFFEKMSMLDRFIGGSGAIMFYAILCAIIGLIYPKWGYSFGKGKPSRLNTVVPFLGITILIGVILFIIKCIHG